MSDEPTAFCPGCEERDEMREFVAIRWCYRHAPSDAGSADALVPPPASDFSTQSCDVQGEENRKRCGLVHRGVAR